MPSFSLTPEVVVLGLIGGLTYGLLGIGLSLVYKSSRVLNFAHGEIGALPALVLAILVINNGWPYWIALLLALVMAATIGGVIELLVIRRLREASRLVVLVATLGISQVLFFIGILIPRGEIAAASFPTPFTLSVMVRDLWLGTGHLLTLIVAPAVVIGLTVFFQRGRLGRATRAAAENVEAAQVAGVPVHRVSQAMWILAALLAVSSAILVGPLQPITAQAAMGPSLMVRALGAAMIGGLVSLPGVFVGGLVIGVIEAVVLWNYPVGGALEAVLLVVIVVSLLLRKDLGHLARGGEESSWSITSSLRRMHPRRAAHPKVRSAKAIGLAALLVLAVLFPIGLTTSQRFFMTTVVLFALMGLSLVVLTGYAGQISLGQFALVGVGAAVGGRLIQLGHPHVTGMLFAAIAGGLVALAVGLPALRIRGLFLAVTTLAFAVATSSWMFNQDWLVYSEGGLTSLRIPRPEVLGISFDREMNYYWLCLVVLVLVAAVVHRIRNTGIGRSFVAVRDNERAAATLSISPRRMKLLAFGLSGVIAGLAGFLYGGLLVNFAYNPSSVFGPGQSLALVAIVIFGGVTTVTGAVLGAFWVRGMPHLFGAEIGILSSGLGILVILLIVPGGLVVVAFAVRDKVAAWLTPEVAEDEPALDEAEVPEISRLLVREDPLELLEGQEEIAAAVDGQLPIVARGVSVRFGGHTALDDVSIHALPGEVVGLMGPNGAGKTTLFDVLSGHLQPLSGEVLMNGEQVGHLPPHLRARLGLGRTFQQARLFDDLSVIECLEVAMECRAPSKTMASLLGLPVSRAAERSKRSAASDLVDLLGIGAYAHRPVAELSTGLRRVTELGCVVAMGSRILLLDEPTAGFSREEIERFQPLLGQIREHLGATVVVIDHAVPLMARLVERLYVLVDARVVAEGPPSILQTDPAVARSYFGTEAAVSDTPKPRARKAKATARGR